MFTEVNNILLYSVKNSYSYSLISESVSTEKLLGSFQVYSWGYKFPQNTNFHLKASILSLATRECRLFPWSESSTLLIFEKTLAKYPSLNKHCKLYSQLKMVFCKNRLIVQTVAQVFYFGMQQKVLFVFPISPQRILGRYKKGWDLIQYNILIKFNEINFATSRTF